MLKIISFEDGKEFVGKDVFLLTCRVGKDLDGMYWFTRAIGGSMYVSDFSLEKEVLKDCGFLDVEGVYNSLLSRGFEETDFIESKVIFFDILGEARGC